MKEYYDRPTQVMFIEEEDLLKNSPDHCTYYEGIAYQNYIICKCCGAVLDLNEMAYIYDFNGWYDYGCENFYELTMNEEIMSGVKADIEETYNWLMEDRP